MTKKDANEILELLAKEFSIIKPNLSWSNRAKRGHAWFRGQNRIACGPKCWRGIEATLLHEFAHILCWRRKSSYLHMPGHTEFFWQTLETVCLAWYGDFENYPWHTEYKRGRAWAAGRAERERGKP